MLSWKRAVSFAQGLGGRHATHRHPHPEAAPKAWLHPAVQRNVALTCGGLGMPCTQSSRLITMALPDGIGGTTSKTVLHDPCVARWGLSHVGSVPWGRTVHCVRGLG